MPKPVVIVHFQPVELYPPLMNLLEFMHKQDRSGEVVVLTTATNTDIAKFNIGNSKVVIKRLAKIESRHGAISRYLNYLLFYTLSFLILIKRRPAAILYFETLSAYPVWLYKKFIARRVPVFIHYHEYTSPHEYATGMLLNRYFHKKEKWLYTNAIWISHTNEQRLNLFLKDEGLNEQTPAYVMPNYPSRSWKRDRTRNENMPIRVVYVGALSLDTMYVEVFIQWLLKSGGKVTLDIYSNNIEAKTKKFIEELNEESIRLHKGVSYQQLPALLEKYDVGVILYNGHIPNYVFNAPNKLFEYLACGLDVWFPLRMEGCLPYQTTNSFPKVIPFDFSDPNGFDPENARNINGHIYKESSFYCETVLVPLIQAIGKYSS
jgi:hypothetical protein